MPESGVTAIAGPASPGFVVVDATGELFEAIRRLDLGAALWRTNQIPNAGMPPGAVVLLGADGGHTDASLEQCASRWVTVVVARQIDEDDRLAALRGGAFGYMSLDVPEDNIKRTLRGVLRGEPAFPRELLGKLVRERGAAPTSSHGGHVDRLTRRQQEIVSLIASGATDKEIGVALGIRTATAQKHVANLLRRLGVSNRAGAVGLLLTEGAALHRARLPDTRRR